ncbi:MAG: putative dehydrogenase [Candidatus Paceibacteria bacterium]|jgi:predicted dehydrogenase
MNSERKPSPVERPSRRTLLHGGGVLAAAAAIAPYSSARKMMKPGGDEVLRVGLVGCGGRGRGAAANALRADPNVKLVALADAFADPLEDALSYLSQQEDLADKVDVDPEHRFVGFDAYKGVIETCDVVLLATSPHFRPLHMEAAVEAGKHLFVEKPVATCPTGLRRTWAAVNRAREKGLNVVSGLCYRYEFGKQETVKRVHDGEIGDIVSMQTTYNVGGLWHRGNKPEWSTMEYQMRNWLYFTWLSGDHIAEQHIHSLDKLAWAKGAYPVKATSSGGRSQRVDEKYGNIFDHFNTVYEWEDGVRGFSSCRQWNGASADVSDYVLGTGGKASLQSHRIETPTSKWSHRGEGPDDMYQNEHNALFAAIRKGEVIDNGDYMCESTMMAIMGRLSAYTGQTVTREQLLESKLDLAPASYEWGEIGAGEIAVPGVTPFI